MARIGKVGSSLWLQFISREGTEAKQLKVFVDAREGLLELIDECCYHHCYLLLRESR